MFVIGAIVFYVVLALFSLVVFAHVAIPYAMLRRRARGEPGHISGLMGIDVVLLVIAVVLARVSGACSAGTLLAVGLCVIVGSYVHGWLAWSIGIRFVPDRRSR